MRNHKKGNFLMISFDLLDISEVITNSILPNTKMFTCAQKSDLYAMDLSIPVGF